MKVKAIRLGYYDLKRRKVGQEFEIEHESEFSPEWMEKFGAEKVEAAPSQQSKKGKHNKFTEPEPIDLNSDSVI